MASNKKDKNRTKTKRGQLREEKKAKRQKERLDALPSMGDDDWEGHYPYDPFFGSPLKDLPQEPYGDSKLADFFRSMEIVDGEEKGNFFDLVKEGSESLSDVIIDFAQPLLALSEGEGSIESEREGKQFMVFLAVLAWNISILPEEEFEEFRDRFVTELVSSDMLSMFNNDQTEEITLFLNGLFTGMYAHKQEFFAEDNRFVMGFFFDDDELDEEGTQMAEDDEIPLIAMGIVLPAEIDTAQRRKFLEQFISDFLTPSEGQ